MREEKECLWKFIQLTQAVSLYVYYCMYSKLLCFETIGILYGGGSFYIIYKINICKWIDYHLRIILGLRGQRNAFIIFVIAPSDRM